MIEIGHHKVYGLRSYKWTKNGGPLSGSEFCQECQNPSGRYWLFNGGVPYWIMILTYDLQYYNQITVVYTILRDSNDMNQSIVKMIVSHMKTILYHAVAIWVFRQSKVLKRPITLGYHIYHVSMMVK